MHRGSKEGNRLCKQNPVQKWAKVLRYKKELLAVVFACKHFRHYLYGNKVTVRTDHSALKWLMSFKDPQGQVARWIEFLSTYNLEIHHRPCDIIHSNRATIYRRKRKDFGMNGTVALRSPIATFQDRRAIILQLGQNYATVIHVGWFLYM